MGAMAKSGLKENSVTNLFLRILRNFKDIEENILDLPLDFSQYFGPFLQEFLSYESVVKASLNFKI